MLNTSFTLQELCYFWIKKSLFLWFFFLFLFFSFFRFFKGIHALWIRNFCWLHWLNVKITGLFFFVAKMSTDINFWGQCRSCIVAMFLFFESTKCAFNLMKRHHNTNGSFCSTPPPPTWIRLFRRKKSAPFSFLNSYCHFLGPIAFPCAVKRAQRFLYHL